jgi:hypothetical protein
MSSKDQQRAIADNFVVSELIALFFCRNQRRN